MIMSLVVEPDVDDFVRARQRTTYHSAQRRRRLTRLNDSCELAGKSTQQ